jgi:ribonuclease HI
MTIKTLKLDHKLAQQVAQGVKTSTWRIYDDKNISVNDHIEFIDKRVSDDPTTWTPIARARVTRVIEKRLGDINNNDFDGHARYSSPLEMLKHFQHFYGPEVQLTTPIKLISFELINTKIDEKDTTIHLSEAKLYADGGSRGNPGPSASGFAILDMDDQIVVKNNIYLGVTTNNQAEYQALKFGLEEALSRHIRVLHVFMDSLLVVNQMRGIFKVKNRDLWPVHESVKSLLPRFKKVTFSHVPRELNKIADAEVNQALDNAAARQ